MDRVLQCLQLGLKSLQLGLKSVHAPTELGDGSVVARTPTA